MFPKLWLYPKASGGLNKLRKPDSAFSFLPGRCFPKKIRSFRLLRFEAERENFWRSNHGTIQVSWRRPSRRGGPGGFVGRLLALLAAIALCTSFTFHLSGDGMIYGIPGHAKQVLSASEFWKKNPGDLHFALPVRGLMFVVHLPAFDSICIAIASPRFPTHFWWTLLCRKAIDFSEELIPEAMRYSGSVPGRHRLVQLFFSPHFIWF